MVHRSRGSHSLCCLGLRWRKRALSQEDHGVRLTSPVHFFYQVIFVQHVRPNIVGRGCYGQARQRPFTRGMLICATALPAPSVC